MIDSLESLLCCPYCKSELEKKTAMFECHKCNISYPIQNQVYFFNTKNIMQQSNFFRNQWIRILNNTNSDNYEMPHPTNLEDSNEIRQICPNLSNKVILDAGCGTGLSTMTLLRDKSKIIFMDIIPETLILAQKLIKLNRFNGEAIFIVADISNIPIKKNSIDIVWSGGVLEHFRDLKDPLVRLCGVLKVNGKLIFTVPNKFGLQRIISSIKEFFQDRDLSHYETGFLYNHLYNLMPKKFGNVEIVKTFGIISHFHEYLISKIPIPRRLRRIIDLLYLKIITILENITFSIHFGPSWFIVSINKK